LFQLGKIKPSPGREPTGGLDENDTLHLNHGNEVALLQSKLTSLAQAHGQELHHLELTIESLSAQVSDANTQFASEKNRFEERISALASEKAALENDLARQRGETASNQRQVSVLNAKIAQHEIQIEQLIEQNSGLKRDISEKQLKIYELESHVVTGEKTATDKAETLIQLSAKLAYMQTSLDSAQLSLARAEEKSLQLSVQCADLTSNLEQKTVALQSAQSDLLQIKAERDNLVTKYDFATERLSKVENDLKLISKDALTANDLVLSQQHDIQSLMKSLDDALLVC
jgi:chromosome segregation ATPase